MINIKISYGKALEAIMKNIKKSMNSFVLLIIITSAFSVLSSTVYAVEDFYKGNTVSVVIRSTAGGGYDSYGRLVARHIGKHIPGNPRVIPINRPGAGGIVAANYMFNQAPQDGSEILIPAREFVFAERVGESGIRYSSLDFNFLGSATAGTMSILAGPNVHVANLTDLSNYEGTFRFGVSGRSGGSYVMAMILQAAGYNVDVVTGFEGSGDQVLAALRGNTQGYVTTWAPDAIDLIENEGFSVFAKLGDSPDLDHIDDFRDFMEGDALALAEVLLTPMSINRPFVTGPGVPEDRVIALQAAFKATLEDPEFLSDAERSGLNINYVGPGVMRSLYEATMNAPDSVIQTYLGE